MGDELKLAFRVVDPTTESALSVSFKLSNTTDPTLTAKELLNMALEELAVVAKRFRNSSGTVYPVVPQVPAGAGVTDSIDVSV